MDTDIKLLEKLLEDNLVPFMEINYSKNKKIKSIFDIKEYLGYC